MVQLTIKSNPDSGAQVSKISHMTVWVVVEKMCHSWCNCMIAHSCSSLQLDKEVWGWAWLPCQSCSWRLSSPTSTSPPSSAWPTPQLPFPTCSRRNSMLLGRTSQSGDKLRRTLTSKWRWKQEAFWESNWSGSGKGGYVSMQSGCHKLAGGQHCWTEFRRAKRLTQPSQDNPRSLETGMEKVRPATISFWLASEGVRLTSISLRINFVEMWIKLSFYFILMLPSAASYIVVHKTKFLLQNPFQKESVQKVQDAQDFWRKSFCQVVTSCMLVPINVDKYNITSPQAQPSPAGMYPPDYPVQTYAWGWSHQCYHGTS